MQVHKGEMMGVTYKYVIAPSGRFLYEQKRHLNINTWVTMICKGLLSRGFTWEDIEQRWNDIFNKNNYCNSSFYRPVRSMVQEQVELKSC